MAIDASIPLQVQTPQFASPLQNAGSVMQLAGGIGRLAYERAQAAQAAAQTQDIQAQAQQRNRDLADQNTIQQAMKDPATAKAFGAGDFSSIAGQVQPKTYTSVSNAILDSHQKAATLTADQLKNQATRHDEIERGLSGLASLPDDASRAAAYPALIQHLQSEGYLEGIQAPPSIDGSLDTINQLAARNALQQGMYSKVLANKTAAAGLEKTQAETTAQKAQASLHAAETPGAKAKSDIEQAQAAALKNLTPQTVGAQVDAELNPANYSDPKIRAEVVRENAIAKTAAHAALPNGFPAVQAAIKDSVDRIGRLSTGVASAAATVPSKVTVLQGGANIGQQTAAKKDYQESLDAVQHVQATAQTIKDLTAQAAAGNSTANAQLRAMLAELTNGVQGIKRMGGGQMDAQLGSLTDRIKGFIGGAAEGVNLPPRVLGEIPGVVDTLAAASTRAHNAHVDTTNGLYNTTFPHVDTATPAVAGAKAAVGGYQIGHLYGKLEYLGGDPKDQANWK